MLKADKTLDGFLGLDPDVTIPPRRASEGDEGRHVRRRRLDGEIQAGGCCSRSTSSSTCRAISRRFAMLFVTNLNTVGNGRRPHRAGDHQQGNASRIAKLASQGTGRSTNRGGLRGPRLPLATESAASTSRRALVSVGPLKRLLLRRTSARSSAHSSSTSASATSPVVSTGWATRRSPPAGRIRQPSTASWRCRSRC